MRAEAVKGSPLARLHVRAKKVNKKLNKIEKNIRKKSDFSYVLCLLFA